MITTANYLLKATVGGEEYFFEYETDDMWNALEEFWHEDYPEALQHLAGSDMFPFVLYSIYNGKVLDCYAFTFNTAIFHAFYDHGHKADGVYTLDEFDRDIRRKVKNYGMTIQYICDRIAEFTGDKKKEAMRKAKRFRANCCVPLTEVEDFRLSFGKYGDGHGNYYGENRDTLHFYYKDSDGDSHQFSILE